jgi:protein TonB
VNQVIQKPLAQSVILHLSLVFIVLILNLLTNFKFKKKIEFEVYVQPAVSSAVLNPKIIDQPTPSTMATTRKVFGVNKKAITAEGETNVEIKSGNTVAKENDNLIMDPSDADALPIPTDEYLVKSMPAVIKEYRAQYPAEAKQKEIEGAVILDLLIDTAGKVRDIKLIKGVGFGMDEAAIEALKQFEFRPAIAADGPVSVRIRYTYRFSLTE